MSVDQAAFVFDAGTPENAASVKVAKGAYGTRTVSAVNTANAVVVDLFNLHDSLSIHSVCSAGTAAVTVEVSADGANYVTIDTVAAAATVVKFYSATTVGATVAVSPLSYRFVRITAATAGGGNTTTLTIAAK